MLKVAKNSQGLTIDKTVHACRVGLRITSNGDEIHRGDAGSRSSNQNDGIDIELFVVHFTASMVKSATADRGKLPADMNNSTIVDRRKLEA